MSAYQKALVTSMLSNGLAEPISFSIHCMNRGTIS